jgi:phage-related tail protein
VQELQQTYNGLLGSVQRQRQALKESGIDTKQLSSAQRELRKNADETRQALERQQKSLKRLGEQQAKMNAAREQYSRRLEVRDRIAGAGATTTAAGLAMGAPVMAAVKSYASMEDAMKGVAKQVNGLRDDNGNRTKQFYDMQDAIKAASEQLPMENGAIDYAALVEGGARMGVTNRTIHTKTRNVTCWPLPVRRPKRPRRLNCPPMNWLKGWVKSPAFTRCRPAISSSWAMR